MFYLDFPEENDKYPCYVLQPTEWDDYSYRTEFALFLCKKKEQKSLIGHTKIIHKFLKLNDNENYVYTKTLMQSCFEKLDENFASLGEKESYYRNIKNLEDKYELLENLRDCSYNMNILDGFPKYLLDNRLFRSIDSEKLFIEGRFIVSGKKPDDLFHFDFPFTPKYNERETKTISFCLDHKKRYFPNSIYCIIGENGSGKTQILKSIPLFIHNNKINCHKIIHLSNNIFERKWIPEYEGKPEYVYLGLNQEEDNKNFIIEKNSLETGLVNILNNILERYFEEPMIRDKLNFGFRVLENLYKEKIELIEITSYFEMAYNDEKKFEPQKFTKLLIKFNLLSSGESILFFNIVKLLSTIQYYSLFLIDEPEIYLHPNFITEYMKFLYKILDKFNSVAIIATHSVFVIREVKSSCVYMIKRDGNNFAIDNIPRETLGANAMTICEDVFDTKNSFPYYKNKIIEMKTDGYSEENIINFLTTRPDNDLDIGLKLYIRDICN